MKSLKTAILTALFFCSFSVLGQVPDLGLIAWYEFSGNTQDSSVNGNDATVHGPILTEDRLGQLDSAYFFDGDHDYMITAPSESLRINDKLTVAAWVKLVDWGYAHFIAAQGTHFDTTGNWEFRIGYNGQLVLSANNHDHWPHFGELAQPRSTGSILFGEWHHVCVTFKAGLTRFYIDGVLDNEEKYAIHYFRDTNDGIKIGEKEHAPGYADAYGAIDEVMIYNRALTGDEVETLYLNGTCSYGPESPITVVRGKGKPVTEVFEWDSCGGNGLMLIESDSLSSAWAYLNGQLVLEPNQVNPNITGINIPVYLTEDKNILEVKLAGAPGSQATINFQRTE